MAGLSVPRQPAHEPKGKSEATERETVCCSFRQLRLYSFWSPASDHVLTEPAVHQIDLGNQFLDLADVLRVRDYETAQQDHGRDNISCIDSPVPVHVSFADTLSRP